MKRLLLAGLLALPVLLASTRTASAQAPVIPPNCFGAGGLANYPTAGPPCGFLTGCRGVCLNWFGKIHFHGPLFNYGPYQGYYPFEPYGPWTSDLRYNPPPAPCKDCGNSSRWGGWNWYSKLTFKNVLQRINPIAHKCGKGGWSDCSSCGGAVAAVGATAVSIPDVPATSVAAGAR